MTDYDDYWYQSKDGLKLYARDYSKHCSKDSPVILCMHGLTRNSADFEDICELLMHDYRLVVVDQRGRGRSAYDPNTDNYTPAVYVQDMFTLLEKLELNDVILMGTSMGGLMSMMMIAMNPTMFRASIINDIGPDLDPRGVARIQHYLGQIKQVKSWQDAMDQTKSINQVAFPLESDEFWQKFARRVYFEDPTGRLNLAYDPLIAEPFNKSDSEQTVDLWDFYQAAANKPVLVIRGAVSDLMSKECVTKMKQVSKQFSYAEIPDVGHAPILNEPEAVQAIKDFLTSIAASNEIWGGGETEIEIARSRSR